MMSSEMVAISIGDAPDRGRLGYPQQEIDRILLSICTALVRAGYRIAYSGNLDPSGFTFKIFRHLAKAYAVRRSTPPFTHVVPKPILQRTGFQNLVTMLAEARGIVDTVAVGDERTAFGLRLSSEAGLGATGSTAPADRRILVLFSGRPVRAIESARDLDDWLGPASDSPATAYSNARRFVATQTAGRIVMGGRMGQIDLPDDHYEGSMPGVIEEAILTLELRRPLIVLGAFGGAARDLAIALGLLPTSERVPRGWQHPTYEPAIAKAEELRTRLPDDPEILRTLSAIARDDRSEAVGHSIAGLLERWHREDAS